jgi:hypothetical protein
MFSMAKLAVYRMRRGFKITTGLASQNWGKQIGGLQY